MKPVTKILLAIAGAFICSLLSGGLTFVALENGLGSPEVASWVQAVGSIAALGIAIYVMSRQNAHSAKLVADADRIATFRRARSVAAVLLRAYEQVKAIDAKMRAAPDLAQEYETRCHYFKASLDLLLEIITSIKAIPAYDLGSYHMADGILQFEHALSTYKSGLEYLSRNPNSAGQSVVVEHINRSAESVRMALKKFDAGLDEIKQ